MIIFKLFVISLLYIFFISLNDCVNELNKVLFDLFIVMYDYKMRIIK